MRPPVTAAQALSDLLWQPYEYRDEDSETDYDSSSSNFSNSSNSSSGSSVFCPPIPPPPRPALCRFARTHDLRPPLLRPAELRNEPQRTSNNDSSGGGRGNTAARVRYYECAGSGGTWCYARCVHQSPGGVRYEPPPSDYMCSASFDEKMRLSVPAPVTPKKCAVTLQVPGEPIPNVSSVSIVPIECEEPIAQNNNNGGHGSGGIEPGRSFASAQCQTEDPATYNNNNRRAARRPRTSLPRRPIQLESTGVPPPPYSTLPSGGLLPLPSTTIAIPPPPPRPGTQHHRATFQPAPVRSSRATRAAAQPPTNVETSPKSCCGISSENPPPKWLLVTVALCGVCCMVAGGFIEAQNMALLLLVFGVAIVVMSLFLAVLRMNCGALCAPRRRREPATNAMNRRLVPRMPPSYARPYHPYAAMMYPEFHYRPPPPTYQASMQDYRLTGLMAIDRNGPILSPPPAYRNNSSLISNVPAIGWYGSENGGPPSYRGRPQPAIAPTINENDDDKSENMVTVVNTEPPEPVIVTVSGATELEERAQQLHHVSEIDILAHL